MMHVRTSRRKLQIAAIHETKKKHIKTSYLLKSQAKYILILPIVKIQRDILKVKYMHT